MVRRIFIVFALLALLPIGLTLVLLAAGTIDRSSVRMVLNVMTGLSGPAAEETLLRQRYAVPDGFVLNLYEDDLPGARFLHVTPSGDLLVSRPHKGDIVLLKRDQDGDGKPDGRVTLLSSLRRPLGLDIHDDWLYVAESNRIIRVPFDSALGLVAGNLHVLVAGLTDNGNHWSKTLRVGPDDKLYLAQGSTCNICEEDDPRRATIMRFELDGSGGEIIATGLRNSVGFDWAPWDDALFATENGRDLLGDDTPPCELNRITAGRFYGWPYFYGENVADAAMEPDPLAAQRQPTAPVHGFRAHNAPLGMTFLRWDKRPTAYKNSALVALHGSWNRSSPDGYKVVSLHWTQAGIEEKDFLSGFLQDGNISGRPVDVTEGTDGTIYISDDYAGAIYSVHYGVPDQGGEALTLPSTLSTKSLDETPPSWLAGADRAAMADNGAALYAQHACRSCHEEGNNPARLEGLEKRLGYQAVVDLLATPPAPMPLFPLSETQRRELAVYLLDARGR
ncbi:MAG: PQQ-dependent sugar dehydrogenase [Halioglobus sp.]|nr:PQQ-dependent sugar dehydrogenase [Halioglobus sp.]